MSEREPIKAMFASEFWPGSTARSLLPALEARGWEVERVDTDHFFPKRMSLAGRAAARVRRGRQSAMFNRAIIDGAKTSRPDVFLTVKGTDVSAATVAALQASGVFCANYYPDYHFNDIGIDRVAAYDLVATTKSFHLAALRECAGPGRVAFVSHGYSDEFHCVGPDPQPERDVDLLYIGNAGPAKVALMTGIVEALAGVRIRIVGHGWAKTVRRSALAAVEIVEARHGDAYTAEIARAKIVLAFHNGPDAATGWADLVSTRTFEIPACGGFMLHIDNDEVRSLYAVPSEIETFTTPENAVAKIRYWLAHPDEREAVAARGHARAVPAYGYAARGRELAQMIEARLAA